MTLDTQIKALAVGTGQLFRAVNLAVDAVNTKAESALLPESLALRVVAGNAPAVDAIDLSALPAARQGAHQVWRYDDFDVTISTTDGTAWAEVSRVSSAAAVDYALGVLTAGVVTANTTAIQAVSVSANSSHTPVIKGKLLELYVDSGDLSVTDSPETQTFIESDVTFTVVRVTVSGPTTDNQRVRVYRNGRYPVHVDADIAGQDAGVGGVVIGANKEYIDLQSSGGIWIAYPSSVTVNQGDVLSLGFNFTKMLAHKIITNDGTPYKATYPDTSVVYVASGAAHTQTVSATAGSVQIELQPTSKITRIQGLSTVFSFDIAELSRLASIEYLDLSHTAVTGDIYALSNLTTLKKLYVNHTAIYGDLSALSNLVNMEEFHLHLSSIKGDIYALRNLTKMVTIRIDNSGVSGDPSSLSTLAQLTTLYANNGKVQGDFTAISTMASLETMYYSAGLTSGQVDTMINQLAASGLTGVTANISYGNAARTSDSDADVATLSGRSWTLTTTP